MRRYQYADGSLTPAGYERYYGKGKNKSFRKNQESSYRKNRSAYLRTGKQYVDSYLDTNTKLSRIQNSDRFNSGYAFYATYKKDDVEKYIGLFGKNLKMRAEKESALLEKEARTREEKEAAKVAVKRAEDMEIYRLKMSTSGKLKIPSDENASDILSKMLDDDEFKKNVTKSLYDSKQKMKRPVQQHVFNSAIAALKQDSSKISKTDKDTIYKAFNLSLVNHEEFEIAAQNKFYKELSKKGYDALLDYNDKEYSSYHADRPMIVFNTSKIALDSVSTVSPSTINSLSRKYNVERIVKEIPANTVGYVSKLTNTLASAAKDSLSSFIERVNR